MTVTCAYKSTCHVIRPVLSRLVNLFRTGPVDVQYQGASFRFYHQVSATSQTSLGWCASGKLERLVTNSARELSDLKAALA